MTDTIRSVEVLTTSIPLPEPLHLGAMEVRVREYAAIRVTTTGGAVGRAYCLTRDAPVRECVERLLTPHVLGGDAAEPERLWDRCFRATAAVGRVGLVIRALGLLDIALWDLAAQLQGRPLWRMLGGTQPAAEVMMVSAYPLATRTPESLADDVIAHGRRGFRHLKVARDADAGRMRRLLEHARTGLPAGCRIVVDGGFGWRNAQEALDELATWDDPVLGWLEDPLVPEDTAGYTELRQRSGMPIGAGDDVTDPGTLRALLDADAIDVLRLDVVSIGGVTAARRVQDVARERGVPVSFHIYPEISVHLAATHPGALVETFDADVPGGNPLDPAHRLIEHGPSIVDGVMRAPETPGLGFDLDWQALAA